MRIDAIRGGKNSNDYSGYSIVEAINESAAQRSGRTVDTAPWNIFETIKFRPVSFGYQTRRTSKLITKHGDNYQRDRWQEARSISVCIIRDERLSFLSSIDFQFYLVSVQLTIFSLDRRDRHRRFRSKPSHYDFTSLSRCSSKNDKFIFHLLLETFYTFFLFY